MQLISFFVEYTGLHSQYMAADGLGMRETRASTEYDIELVLWI